LVADGSALPPWVCTAKLQIKTGTIDVSAEGGHVEVIKNFKVESELMAKKWLDWVWGEGHIKEGNVLLSNNGPGFSSRGFINEATSYGLCLLHFPPLEGCIMNPCDNSFHAVFKQRLCRLFSKERGLDVECKIKLIIKAYCSIKPRSVTAFMCHCGISGGKPHAVVRWLLSTVKEWISPNTSIWLKWHKQYIDKWLAYCNQWDHPSPPLHEIHKLKGDTLDGIYWQWYSAVE
jgi:hypothetical protein